MAAGRVEVHLFTSALEGGERSASRCHWTQACLGPGADVDNLENT